MVATGGEGAGGVPELASGGITTLPMRRSESTSARVWQTQRLVARKSRDVRSCSITGPKCCKRGRKRKPGGPKTAWGLNLELGERPSHFRRAELRAWNKKLDAWPPVSAPAQGRPLRWAEPPACSFSTRGLAAHSRQSGPCLCCSLTKLIQASRLRQARCWAKGLPGFTLSPSY